MKNKNIGVLVSILSPLPLDIEKSSARRRFLRHLKGFKEDFDLEGEYIRKEFGEKAPDGSLKVIKNVFQFTKENRKLAEEKFNTLNDLSIEIDWSGEEKDKEVVVEILEGLLVKEKEAKEFNNDKAEYIFVLEEILEELK